jgi:hypothetical protein
MVAHNPHSSIDIRPPSDTQVAQGKNSFMHHRRVHAPSKGAQLVSAISPASKMEQQSHRLDEMIDLLHAKSLETDTQVDKNTLSSCDYYFQGMASLALRKAHVSAHFPPCLPMEPSKYQQRSPKSWKGGASKDCLLCPAQWAVQVDRSAGESLGIQLDGVSQEVLSVAWYGLVGMWNLNNPGKELRAGDKVVKVNGYSGVDRILVESQKAQTLHIVAERATRTSRKPLRSGQWRIEIDHTRGDELGITLDTSSMQVLSISWTGSVCAWNIDKPNLCVKPGDKIVQVNGACVADKIIEELKQFHVLDIVVERSAKLAVVERSAKPAVEPKDNQWSVEIDRSNGDPLGFTLDTNSQQILSIAWQGLLGAWNVDNPSRSAKPCDRVLQVNGYNGVDEIIAECKMPRKLHMLLERAPRPIVKPTICRQWTVEIDRTCDQPLGMSLDIHTLKIRSIPWQGLLCTWNIDNPIQSVKPGDAIVQVNKCSAASDIIAECKKSGLLRLVMKREIW